MKKNRSVPEKKPAPISGVILAAGAGSRIQPLSASLPKAMLPVCNKPILQYQIEDMKSLGIREFFIVVGHLKGAIMDYFGDGSKLGVKIKYVEQKQMLGIAHAVGQLEKHVTGPFLMFLGDIFMVPRRLEKMLQIFKTQKASAVLAVKKEPVLDYIKRNFAVVLNRKGLVQRVIEKPRFPPNDLKGCGIYLFDLDIFDAIRRTSRTAMRDEYEITSSIQILVEDGLKVSVADVVEWDMNVTVPYDLIECNILLLKHQGRTQAVGEECVIPDGTVIQRSVIGRRVKIEHPIRIFDSVVLEGSVLSSQEDVRSSIVTPEGMVRF